jgi:cobalt-zinc-cadmium efflux system membrane fusion protein
MKIIMNNLHKSINLLLVLFATILCISCGNKAAEESTDAKEEEANVVEFSEAQYETASIELGKVESRQISATVRASGMLDVPPQQLVSISIPLGGFLKSTELLQGYRVKKGQMIATLESMDFVQMQQEYLEARNQFNFSKTDYERQQVLAKENINAEKTLQQSQSNFQTWQAKMNGLSAKLKMLHVNLPSLDKGDISNTINVYSPINGYVTEVNVNIGKFVNPSDVLFEIVNTEHLHAELTIFEKDIPKIKIGQKVRFTLANENKERISTVYLIGRKITTDRTIRIHCHIDTVDTQLLPGMYLKAMVETGGVQVAALPDEAVIDYQGKKYIFVTAEEPKHQGDYHFAMIEIHAGIRELGYTEVTPLEDFDFTKSNVVIRGAYALLSKMKNTEEEE